MKILSIRAIRASWWSRRNLGLLAVAVALLATLHFARAAKDPTDVTAIVAPVVKDERLVIAATNERFGDTAPGVPKKLRVEYSIGAEKLAREVPEGGRLEIAAPAGQKLVILKAVYGPADGSKPVAAAALAENPGEVLDTLPGFTLQHVLRADGKTNGSWICMAKDPKGRLLLGGQRGQPITRVTLQDGKVVKTDLLHLPVSETMGMLFVGDVLYINGSGSRGFALYRCKDTKHDDSFDDVELLHDWRGGAGEHGSHGIVLGPDKMLYVVSGNFTPVPKELAPSSPHRNFGDDLALKRMEDGNGFGAGAKPPGGYVARMDLDGKNVEMFSAGQRNDYDVAFNADGELFGFDSDMEWDWGSPWYRPIRVFHSVRGGDHGFREGSAKWPEYYADSLPASVTIGIGCPTGVMFGTGAKFPVKYQKAFFICDWTYGRLIAVHLTPNGASYTGSWENFVAPKSLRGKGGRTPLNLTDVVIGDDGALYFTTGGRGTQADLFRVTCAGSETATPLTASQLSNQAGKEARALRRQLEAFNVKADPAAVPFAWPHLNSPDRFIRYAARLAIERNPVSEWQDRALAEKQPQISASAAGQKITGELALLGNGRFYGGSFHIFPEAHLSNGLLDVCVFPKVNLGAGELPGGLSVSRNADPYATLDSFDCGRDPPPTCEGAPVSGVTLPKIGVALETGNFPRVGFSISEDLSVALPKTILLICTAFSMFVDEDPMANGFTELVSVDVVGTTTTETFSSPFLCTATASSSSKANLSSLSCSAESFC